MRHSALRSLPQFSDPYTTLAEVVLASPTRWPREVLFVAHVRAKTMPEVTVEQWVRLLDYIHDAFTYVCEYTPLTDCHLEHFSS